MFNFVYAKKIYTTDNPMAVWILILKN